MSREAKDSAGSGRTRAGKGSAAAGSKDQRQERLARALRDNLKKRKAQQRRRGDGGPAEP
jgi:hypothetical protein